jgi:hypothetical protein
MIKISEQMNEYNFINNVSPPIKQMHKQLSSNNNPKSLLIFPFNLIFEYISIHFDVFDLEIEKLSLEDNYNQVKFKLINKIIEKKESA